MEKTVELHSSYVEKMVEIPQCSSSLLDKVIDMPVDMRFQLPDMVQTVPNSWSSQVQFLIFLGRVHRYTARVDPRHQGWEGVAGTPGACSQVFCHPN